MCWRRQRTVIPGHKASSPSLIAYHHLRFASCAKVLGYFKVDNHSIICQKCYSRLLSTYHKSYYFPLYQHFASDKLLPTILCEICSNSLLTLRTLRECKDCSREHLQFLKKIEKGEENVNIHGNPPILYINGERIDFSNH